MTDLDLDANALDDLGRALMASMSQRDLTTLINDSSEDLVRAANLLYRGDRHGLTVLRRIANRLPRLCDELEHRAAQSGQ